MTLPPSKQYYTQISCKILLPILIRILIVTLLLVAGDVHPNPGPSSTTTLNFMHYNVNSLKTANFSRVHLIESFMSLQNIHIAAISETALNTTVEDSCFDIEGYSTFRKDLTNINIHGGVLLYYRNSLAIKHCPSHTNLITSAVL